MYIFRAPDEDGKMLFIQGSIEDGVAMGDHKEFYISDEFPDDSYHHMKFSNLILAQKVPGGSLDIVHVELLDGDDVPVVVHEIPDLLDIVQHMHSAYVSSFPTIQ
jgi:hypothetical protein